MSFANIEMLLIRTRRLATRTPGTFLSEHPELSSGENVERAIEQFSADLVEVYDEHTTKVRATAEDRLQVP